MKRPTLHVVGLPHTQTTSEYSRCAYTGKVLRFAGMMRNQGFRVVLYAGDENEADCDESVVIAPRSKQADFGFNGPADYLKLDYNDPMLWDWFNDSVIAEIEKRLKVDDIICVITGTPHEKMRQAFQGTARIVEFGIGYTGIMRDTFHVFESEAWKNYVYGRWEMDPADYDTVIPNYYDASDFPKGSGDGDYFLFVGRLNARKGLNIAQDVCERLGARLLVAGQGLFNGYGEYVGTINPAERAELMGNATALFCPTRYLPPFEGVHVEAMLCGTPAITSDFGVFCETVESGVNGYRCADFPSFMAAAQKASSLDRSVVRGMAQGRFSVESVGPLYAAYFDRLPDSTGRGWYG